ncbi:MAG: hypothetical protein K0R29_1116 [Pseudobdellovibrio sp.]|jgi:ribosomal protein S18 acetylase RimI-like enzyme|nr:hypothetical protein [Pseudobdellovibrio sp.]
MQDSSTRFYRHYKNKPYRLLGTVRHSETLEEMALYETLYENDLGRLWVRPKDMFFENVEIDGVIKPRFEKIKFEFATYHSLSQELVAEISALYEVCFQKALRPQKIEGIQAMHKSIVLVVCREKNRLIGFKLGYGKDGDTFYSWVGCVHPEFRELGIAGELMGMQHKECVNANYKKIETRTRNEFTSMLRLNLKNGFKITGTLFSDSGKMNIVMEKLLN